MGLAEIRRFPPLGHKTDNFARLGHKKTGFAVFLCRTVRPPGPPPWGGLLAVALPMPTCVAFIEERDMMVGELRGLEVVKEVGRGGWSWV